MEEGEEEEGRGKGKGRGRVNVMERGVVGQREEVGTKRREEEEGGGTQRLKHVFLHYLLYSRILDIKGYQSHILEVVLGSYPHIRNQPSHTEQGVASETDETGTELVPSVTGDTMVT